MTTNYRLWGLTVASDTSLDEWPIPHAEPDAEADVDLQLEAAPEFWRRLPKVPPTFERTVGDGETLTIHHAAGGWLWRYPDETAFWVSADGCSVRGTWPPHYSVEDALTYLVGPIFGFVLRLRGIPSLHAGAVVVDGGAVAFTGGPGAGKSTLTAEFVRRGYGMLGDDIAALELTENGFMVRPSIPLVKLWEDAALRSGDLPFLSPTWPKRMLNVGDANFVTTATPLRAVFLLGHDRGTVGPAEALAMLSANVYVPYTRDHAATSEDLEFFATLVERVPVCGLPPAETLDDVGRRVDNLLHDLLQCG